MHNYYNCEKYNRNANQRLNIIIDETSYVTSTIYLHTIRKSTKDITYHILSENLWTELPFFFTDNMLIVGTSFNLYVCELNTGSIKATINIESPCLHVFQKGKGFIAICECDVYIVNLNKKIVSINYSFNDMISDFKVTQNCLYLFLFEGGKKNISIGTVL